MDSEEAKRRRLQQLLQQKVAEKYSWRHTKMKIQKTDSYIYTQPTNQPTSTHLPAFINNLTSQSNIKFILYY